LQRRRCEQASRDGEASKMVEGQHGASGD
jgi:hypothetical protein